MQGGSLRAQSQVGWGLWGTSGHTRHPWDQPTEVYAACKPSLTALCALLGSHGGSEKSGKLEVGGASRDSTGLGALEEGLISS